MLHVITNRGVLCGGHVHVFNKAKINTPQILTLISLTSQLPLSKGDRWLATALKLLFSVYFLFNIFNLSLQNCHYSCNII
jgi:hypothetical protein